MEERLMAAVGNLRDDWEHYNVIHADEHRALVAREHEVHDDLAERLARDDLDDARRRGQFGAVVWFIAFLERHWQFLAVAFLALMALLGNIHVNLQ